MNRKLFISYVNYYNQYKPIYDNVIDDISLLIYKRLLNSDNLSISVDSFTLSILTEREEQLLELNKDKIYVGIFFSPNYIISTKNRESSLLGIISPDNLKLDSLLIYLSKFSIFVETEQYINLFKFFKDYWNDYIQLLLDNKLETELDLLPCPIGDESYSKEIDSKYIIVDGNNTLRFYYTTRYKGVREDNKIGLKFYNPDEIFKSIKEACLKTAKSLY